MRKHESYDTCARCGKTYGDHAWKNDACPKSKKGKGFCWFKRFKTIKGGEK